MPDPLDAPDIIRWIEQAARNIRRREAELYESQEHSRRLAEALVGRTVERDRLVAELDRTRKALDDHGRTFSFRPAGEPDDVTVAVRSLGDCGICGQPIPAGTFVVRMPQDEVEGFTEAWAHESCARPGQLPRPALNADQTRDRS